MLRGWKAWYEDGRVYRSSDCLDCLASDFENLPADGLQILILYNEVDEARGREVLSGCDWYWPFKGRDSKHWNGFLPRPKGIKHSLLKRGTAISDEAFQAIWKKAWAEKWL